MIEIKDTIKIEKFPMNRENNRNNIFSEITNKINKIKKNKS